MWCSSWVRPGSQPIHRSSGVGGGVGVSELLRDFLELQAVCLCVHVYVVCMLGEGLGLWEEQGQRLLAWASSSDRLSTGSPLPRPHP